MVGAPVELQGEGPEGPEEDVVRAGPVAVPGAVEGMVAVGRVAEQRL
jgi:hypothetical protein